MSFDMWLKSTERYPFAIRLLGGIGLYLIIAFAGLVVYFFGMLFLYKLVEFIVPLIFWIVVIGVILFAITRP